MPPLELAGLTIFILLLFAGIYGAVIGLPGTILILGSVFFYALLTGFHTIGVGNDRAFNTAFDRRRRDRFYRRI